MSSANSATKQVNEFLDENKNIVIDHIVAQKDWLGIFYHKKITRSLS